MTDERETFFWFGRDGWWFGANPDDRYAPCRGPYKSFDALVDDCAPFFEPRSQLPSHACTDAAEKKGTK